jgi:hypothetical protein
LERIKPLDVVDHSLQVVHAPLPQVGGNVGADKRGEYFGKGAA